MELKGKTLFVKPIQDVQGNKNVWIVQNRVYRICQRGEMNVPAALSPSPSQRGKKTGMCIGRLWDTILPSVMPAKVTTMPSYRITALKQHGHAWHWGSQSDSRITKLSNLWVVLPIEKDDGNKSSTTGTEISVHDCIVIQAKKERAGGIPSDAGDPRLAGFASANPAASIGDRAFCSKGLWQQCWEAQPARPLLPRTVLSETRAAALNSRWAKDLWEKSVIIRISKIFLPMLS